MSAARPLLAVDAPSLLFRAYYALPDTITDPEGRPVNALLGSANVMLRIAADHRPRAVVMCHGQDAADYRVELYEGYHANREETDDDLAWQFDASWDFFEAFAWYTDSREGIEADDLLNSYALAETKAGGRTLVLTGDRDMFQCAGARCKVLYLKTGTRGAEPVDAAEVRRRYGVPPRLVPDFIALRGDPSDGIPGAPGIGPKTAADLLRRHGSLEVAIEAAGGETPRVERSLREHAGELLDFKEIATLRRVRVRRPRSRRSGYRSGAMVARKLGMEQLATRLESLA